ncbi:MAG TPA: DNA-processing protein DprA [Kofleriaceae bacterium]|nr:DNA-processing protein DprA [Kofleriaceae bacterium]
MTWGARVANCFPLVTTLVLSPEQLPRRVQALGWRRPVYLRGAPLDDGPSVAIVGARAASRGAMDRAHGLARHLAGRGVQVVSGGALGVDGAAHRGALAGGGTTTVVLGSGLDVLYPVRHAPLFCEVLAQRGTLAGMVPDGTAPRPGMFPQRNQLIAALADVVIVVEADVRSGSLSTAAAARRFGKIVAAWPGSRGCERLLATGAAVIESEADAELALAGTPRHPAPIAIDPVALQVQDAIARGVVGVDEIVRHTGLTVRAVLRALPMIERMQ